jgi:hypothetical protein
MAYWLGTGGPDGPVGIVTTVWRTRTRKCLSILGRGKRLSFLQIIWTGCEAHRASYSWYGGGTAASVYCECGVVQLPLSVANVGWYSCLRLLRMWGGTSASVCCECGAVQLPLSVANVTNEWKYTSAAPTGLHGMMGTVLLVLTYRMCYINIPYVLH